MTGAGRGASVSLSKLERCYDRVAAVAGVSLDILSGEFLTLLGPSGSGKSTTLMMIAGFETPTGGDIAIDGKSVVAMPPYRRNIGMVFQNYALFPHLTAADNIGFPLKQRGVGKAEREKLVREALALMQLPDHGERYPRQLSGGQQQRGALARAIVFKPRLLLMDEPPWARSTSSSARTCSWRCVAFVPIWASPSSMSPTTRRRLSPCRTVSPS